MRVKLLTFRYSAMLGGFDDTALTDFIRDKEVIAFREHFHCVNEVPHLSCVVHYQDIEGFGPGKAERYGKGLLKALLGRRSWESAWPSASLQPALMPPSSRRHGH